MIAVIDYGAANLRSVTNALDRLKAHYVVCSDWATISGADRVILPGVGEASYAMRRLRELELADLLPTLTQPFLGVCLGMQLLCRWSAEGDVRCLDIIPSDVVRMEGDADNKVPHIGWNEIEELRSGLFEGIESGAFVYYVHSYCAPISEYTICSSDHSCPFSGAIASKNFYGCQFHPEKSGDVGERILKNFLTL
ncbi:MAG: imidazole glycerol phosphate synthase subunit HisH [Rikenellaceae bacterium]